MIAPKTIYTIALIGAASMSLWVLLLSARRRPEAHPYLAVALTGTIIWTLAHTVELVSDDMRVMSTAVGVIYLGIALSVIGWLLLSLFNAGLDSASTRRGVLLAALPFAAQLLLLWTNPLHGWFITNAHIVAANGMSVMQVTLSPPAWLFIGYSYALVLAGFLVHLGIFFCSPRMYWSELLAVLTAALLPAIGSLVSFMPSLNIFYPVEPTSLGFNISAVLLGAIVIRGTLFNFIPLARSTIIENLDQAVVALDRQYNVVSFNHAAAGLLLPPDARASGETGEALLGRWWPLVHQQINGERAYVDFTVEREGEEHTYTLRTIPFQRNQRLAGFVVMAQDVSEHKQLEQHKFNLALEKERIRILTDFVTEASHEFRTPLSVIGTQTYLMAVSDDPGQRYQRAENVEKQIDYLAALLEDMVLLTRLGAGVTETFEPLSINTLITSLCDEYRDDAHARQIALDVVLAPSQPMIDADGGALRRALANILDNALRYTPEGGHVSVQVIQAAEAQQVRILFRDSGNGIAPELQPRIFDSFSRGDTAHTTRGMGLGLPIARRIVELHDGTISVQSAPGSGSTFEVRLPRTNEN